eukprot:gnl/Dysnectes_brevis/779_a857_3379.p1 GENE.gnl/Dysnectes_brevis/779_a857_3379~~gnl/Dysnectes_brevis/779_a857_3379.p1  ORF type:complete len:332 (+),score=57.29 gnl/Dysnectes_brevis/779_a857_3379:58-1053(+)
MIPMNLGQGGGAPPSCGAMCGRFFSTMPLISKILLFGSLLFIAAAWFVHLIFFGGSWVTGPVFLALTYNPSAIFLKGQVWRVFTVHFAYFSFFHYLYSMLMLIPSAYMVEKMMGTSRFLLHIIISILLIDSIAYALSAFLYYTPGVNNWTWGVSTWTEESASGTALMLLLLVLQLRLSNMKEINCCALCMMPRWAYILIAVIFAQLLMYFTFIPMHASAILVGMGWTAGTFNWLQPKQTTVRGLEQKFSEATRTKESFIADSDSLTDGVKPAEGLPLRRPAARQPGEYQPRGAVNAATAAPAAATGRGRRGRRGGEGDTPPPAFRGRGREL